MVSGTRSIRLTAGLVAVTTVASCGGGGTAGASDPGPEALSTEQAQPSGNDQSGPAGGDLRNPLRIVVVRGGVPAAGAVVSWSATGTGAFMVPSVDTTGADGISTSTWHLGSDPGPQAARASVAGGASGSPVLFSATARAPDGGASEVTVQLLSSGGNRFEPANLTIAAGTTVTWTWTDGFHNVVHEVPSGGTPGLASSGDPNSPPRSYSFTFTTPGTYRFFCEVHGTISSGMHGTIEVQ